MQFLVGDMDAIERLLTTAGELDPLKLVLIIGFFGILTLFLRERNAGKDKERDDKFREQLLEIQREQSSQFTAAIRDLTFKFDRYLNQQIEQDRLNREERIQNRAIQNKFIEAQQVFMKQIDADRQYREKLSAQLKRDMAMSKAATSALTAEQQEVKEVVTMTNDSVKKVMVKLDSINAELNEVKQHLGALRADQTAGKMDEVRQDVSRIESKLDDVIQIIKEMKDDVGTTDRNITGSMGGGGMDETTDPQATQESPQPD